MKLLRHRVQQIDSQFFPQWAFSFLPFWFNYSDECYGGSVSFASVSACQKFISGRYESPPKVVKIHTIDIRDPLPTLKELLALESFPKDPVPEQTHRVYGPPLPYLHTHALKIGWMWAIQSNTHTTFMYLPDECSKLQL